MKDLKNFLKNIVFLPTPSGFEMLSADKIRKLCLEFCDGFFTDSRVTNTGSIVLTRSCGKKNAKKICFDAHLDTIGFAVSKIEERGYVRVTNLGGIDVNILASSEVEICTKEPIYGVFSSIPPHLASSDKLPEIGEMLVDTGLSEEEVNQKISVGTPAIYLPHFTELLNDRVSSVHLDDKVCIAAIMQAVKLMDKEKLSSVDIQVYLSSGEERGGNGAHHIYEELSPDALIVLDVNFAKEKGSMDGEYGILGGGAMISYSSVTSRAFTQYVMDQTDSFQPVNEMTYTGTNADVAAKTGKGVATCVVSIPLRYMHSSVEVCDMKDVFDVAKLLKNAAENLDSTSSCVPVYYKGGPIGE